jgi:predicted alpha-1,6-mannanase (GH76 family)
MQANMSTQILFSCPNLVHEHFRVFESMSVSPKLSDWVQYHFWLQAHAPSWLLDAMLRYTSGAFLLRSMLSKYAEMRKGRRSFAMLTCCSFDVTVCENLPSDLVSKAKNMPKVARMKPKQSQFEHCIIS